MITHFEIAYVFEILNQLKKYVLSFYYYVTDIIIIFKKKKSAPKNFLIKISQNGDKECLTIEENNSIETSDYAFRIIIKNNYDN